MPIHIMLNPGVPWGAEATLCEAVAAGEDPEEAVGAINQFPIRGIIADGNIEVA
jgi:hypothetical protein